MPIALRMMLLTFVALVASARANADSDYCVISLVEAGDSYHLAVDELVQFHQADLLTANPNDIEALLPKLQKISPEFVAVVVRPDDFDINLARQMMRLATQIDDDPFLDFAYGFVTGATAEDAVALVRAGQSKPLSELPRTTMVGVGSARISTSRETKIPLRKQSLTQTVHLLSSKPTEDGTDPNRDVESLEKIMPTLDGTPLIVFAGHGYPREVVGGPTFEHLEGRKFDRAVVLNIACYTGVTGRWFETDWSKAQTVQKQVPTEESFCLSLLKTGVAGYVSYACPRPAGPTMLAESITVAISGESLGELRRRRGNNVVLAHLQLGGKKLALNEMRDGDTVKRQSIQDILTEMSSGGVLFGDPAFRPFQNRVGESPIQTSVKKDKNRRLVRVDIRGSNWFSFAADQLFMWDERTPSLRIETTIDLDDDRVTDVRLTSSSFAFSDHKLIATVETHQGKRLLHLKASSAKPHPTLLAFLARNGIFGEFEVTTDDSTVEEASTGDGSARKIFRRSSQD